MANSSCNNSPFKKGPFLEMEVETEPGVNMKVQFELPKGVNWTQKQLEKFIFDSKAQLKIAVRYAKVLKALGIAVDEP